MSQLAVNLGRTEASTTYLAMAAVSGMLAIMTPTPTSMVQPRSEYNETNASVIWKRPLQAIWPYVHRS